MLGFSPGFPRDFFYVKNFILMYLPAMLPIKGSQRYFVHGFRWKGKQGVYGVLCLAEGTQNEGIANIITRSGDTRDTSTLVGTVEASAGRGWERRWVGAVEGYGGGELR